MSLKPDDQATDEMLLHPDHPTEETENDSWVVSARGVSKRFSIYTNDRGRMFEFFGRRTHHREHWALKNVDFQVERGRSFGIIGPNGAGKSTLLSSSAASLGPQRARFASGPSSRRSWTSGLGSTRTSQAARTSG